MKIRRCEEMLRKSLRAPWARGGKEKAQSAIEYLTSYSLAVIIIIVVLIAFYVLGVFSPQGATQRAGDCQVYRPNGPNTTSFLSLVGFCTDLPQQFVSVFDQRNGGSIKISLPQRTFSQVTLTFWIRGANTGSTPQNILYVSGPAGFLFYIYWTPDPVGSSEPWYFVTMTANYVKGTYQFYVDDVVTQSGSSGDVPANSLNIAGAVPRQGLYGFTGQIQNVQLYNVSFSANEVTNLYLEGTGGPPVSLLNLQGWWPLNGNTQDYSGQSHPGNPLNLAFSGTWMRNVPSS